VAASARGGHVLFFVIFIDALIHPFLIMVGKGAGLTAILADGIGGDKLRDDCLIHGIVPDGTHPEMVVDGAAGLGAVN
jgi:hypothetical protein